MANWVQKAADQGHVGAQCDLGVMYQRGIGVLQDYKMAAILYQQPAEQGYASAQYNLGLMSLFGQGMPADDKSAKAWFQKAADQGHADAQYNLGLMYYLGKGVGKDDSIAAVWFQKASDQGKEEAKSALQTLRASGKPLAGANQYTLRLSQRRSLRTLSRGALQYRPPRNTASSRRAAIPTRGASGDVIETTIDGDFEGWDGGPSSVYQWTNLAAGRVRL